MTDYVQVSTAIETREQAVQLAQSVVKERLAAGAQIIGPETSLFWRLGEFGTGEEWQLLLSTHTDRYPALEAHLLKHHPWETPQVQAVPIVAGSPGCLNWLSQNTSPESGK
ncbi:divalent-cation tolerance protein CutA [Streptomyces sp. NPDC006283]|uniref:divalent-cation tolerance protein CutA n=1 Tax=Streptomyces sp. NPDC006283 TaxID=3156741 RepID=UPI0033B29D90